MIPKQAIIAAKEAMREVTPPPGVSKADWLAEYGSVALIAGAIAAAAPYIRAQSLLDAADILNPGGSYVLQNIAKWLSELAATERTRK